MINIIRADLYKLSRTKWIKVLAGVSLVSTVLVMLLGYLIAGGNAGLQMSGIAFMFSDMNIISIAGAAAVSVCICGDFENRTINDAVASGYRRFTIAAGKSGTALIAVFFLLVPYVSGTVAGVLSGSSFDLGDTVIGFVGLLVKEAGTAVTGQQIGRLIAVLFTLLVVYLAQLSICIPLAMICKKQIAVVGIYYGLSIAAGQISVLSQGNEVLSRLYALTPFHSDYYMLTMQSPAGDLMRGVAVSALFITAMIGITGLSFRKAEIK